MNATSLLTAAAIAFAGLALTPKADAQIVKIDGSSTVFPITEAVAEEFQIQKRGKVRVTVGISGTGGGFKKFCRGETDIADASRPILKAEMEACAQAGIKYIELPIAYDALTVVVNPQNNWVDAAHHRRAEEDVGARSTGQDYDLEADQPEVAERAACAVRAGL